MMEVRNIPLCSTKELETVSRHYDAVIAEREAYLRRSNAQLLWGNTGVAALTPDECRIYTSVNDELQRRQAITPIEARQLVQAKRRERLRERHRLLLAYGNMFYKLR